MSIRSQITTHGSGTSSKMHSTQLLPPPTMTFGTCSWLTQWMGCLFGRTGKSLHSFNMNSKVQAFKTKINVNIMLASLTLLHSENQYCCKHLVFCAKESLGFAHMQRPVVYGVYGPENNTCEFHISVRYIPKYPFVPHGAAVSQTHPARP